MKNTMKNKFFKHLYFERNMNKKGFEMAINTIVILVLSILVLIFLVLFFTDAGKIFLSKIGIYQGYSNVDNAVNSCNFYVESNSIYNYCCEKKEIKYFENDKKSEGMFSCLEIEERFGGIKKISCEDVKC